MLPADRFEVLDVSLLEQMEKLREIDHWLRVFNWPNGWHYDLDIIWILDRIDEIGLPQGATILDAGAGLGILQFILASRGYQVISLDFTLRHIPKFSKGIFKIANRQDTDLGGYDHEYMHFMTYGLRREGLGCRLDFRRLVRAVLEPARTAYLATQKLRNLFNPYYLLERRRDHSGFGPITFLRGTFNAIPLPEASVDLLVSVSAFEHNKYEDMPASVREFLRVVKPGGTLLVTTSLAKEKDWYFEPSKGWNLTAASLARWFSLPEPDPILYDELLGRLRRSQALARRLHPFYRFSAESGLPYGVLEEAGYLPVGVCKRKNLS